MKFKIGDWVVHEYRLKQVKGISHDRYSLSDGYFVTSGPNDDSVREANSNTSRIASDCRWYYDKLNKEYSRTIKNWPDLNRWFSQHCIKMIDAAQDEIRFKILYDELKCMYDGIVEACEVAQTKQVFGVKLF